MPSRRAAIVRSVETLYLLVFLLSIALPLHWAMALEIARQESPEYLRKAGVIIKRIEALDSTAEIIGRYRDTPIFASVVFKGMLYEFSGVVSARYPAQIRANELYLEPGLLYVTRA